MICSRCKKRIAVVFMAHMEGDKSVNEGYCLTCAKELGIKQVDDMMKTMGLTEDMLDQMDNDLMSLQEIAQEGDPDENGGATTFPFLNNLFGAGQFPAVPSGGPGAEEPPREKTSPKKAREKKRKFLDQYCENLTRKAEQGQLDRIIGRDREIYRVIQILSRRTKNNPCLIGEPGVGKTAIAEGIALRIAAKDVPFKLMDKELFLLDLTALVAGTQFRGQFESRVKGLIDEVKAAGNIILFIDEVHNLVGTGDSEGSMSAANILKPALSRGEIQVIGATTFNEYRKYIEKDSALERRFQPVTVEEPSVDDTVTVLKGIKEYYEKHHRVHISDELIRLAVTLSERYINDRFLPDKAIDLLDEACACSALKNKDLVAYDKANVELKRLQSEEEAMEQSGDKVDYERLANLKSKILGLTERAKALEARVRDIQVTAEDLAYVIELWTGIPATKIQETELRRVAGLEENLKKKIIGQDEAVQLVSAAIRRGRVQISPRRRPASFIFVGPTGVGKTELVKLLSRELFDTADPLIRLDMSEFMEKHAVSRIIGSPPGYVGYDEAGQLTEKIRRKPYSVILFDEIEKAHPDVMNILLQILDEGRITDAHGRTVNFENTVIVMTSNAGSERKEALMGFGKTEGDMAKEKARKALSEFLRPEFLSRVDEIIVFSPLQKEDYARIAGLMLDELKQPLAEKHIQFGYDDKATRVIAAKAFGGKHGARDLRRVIRKEIEDKIASILVDQVDAPPSILKITGDETAEKIEILSL